MRSNPRITLQDARAIRRYDSPLIAAVMAGANGQGRVTYRDRSIDNTHVQGVTSEYVNFSSFDAERGRLMSPTEVETRAPGRRHRLADRRSAVRHRRSIRSTRSSRSRASHFRIVGVSAKKGSLLGQSQDEFAIIPLGQFQMMFGSRRPLSLTVKPRDLAQIPAGDGRGDDRAAERAAASSRSSRTTSACSRPTRSSTSITRRPTASSRCWSASSRCRSSSAASSS